MKPSHLRKAYKNLRRRVNKLLARLRIEKGVEKRNGQPGTGATK